MGVSVLEDQEKNKAAMYDNTSNGLIGTVYNGHYDSGDELREFVNSWIDGDPREYKNSSIPELFVAYKIEKGFLDKEDWRSQVNKAESILGRTVAENSF